MSLKPAQSGLVIRNAATRKRFRKLFLEQFEARHMMASDWMAAGPFSMTDGQNEGIPNRPVVGAMNVVVTHPFDANTIYTGGVNGGVWKTSNALDASPNWQPLTDALPSLSVGAIALDYFNPETVYMGAGRKSSYAQVGGERSGVYRSDDGGQSWQVLAGNSTLVGKNISALSAVGDTIVAAVNIADTFSYPNIGIFRSDDGGVSFSQISGLSGTGLPGGVSYDLATDPNDPFTLYTSVVFPSSVGGQGIYRSNDAGATWTKVSNSAIDALIGNNTSNIEISVGTSNNVYVGILNSGNPVGLFRSGDAGGSWITLDLPVTDENGIDIGLNPRGFKGPTSGTPEQMAGGQGNIHFSIAADPTNPFIVYVGGDRQPTSNGDQGSFPNSIGAQDYSGRIFRGDASQPVGYQFVHITHRNDMGAEGGGTANNTSPHADSRDMAVDILGNLIEVDDGGIYKRILPNSDQGDWVSLIGNLQTTEMHDVAYDSVSNVLMSGNQDTGTTYQTAQGATVWKSLSTADGGDVAIDDISLASSGRSIRYSSFQNLGAFRRTMYDAAGNLLSTLFPRLNVVAGSGIAPTFRTIVTTNRIVGQRVLIQDQTGILESFDYADSLYRVGTGGGNTSIEQDAVVYGGKLNNVANPDVIWVGGGSDVRVRTTAGGSLSLVGSDPTTSTIRDLEVDPDAYTTAVVVTATQVLLTTNLGTNWSNITGNLLAQTTNIHSVGYIPGVNDVIIAGTNRGIFYTPASAPGNWTKIGTTLPNAIVFEMEYDAKDDVLVAGTFGRGAWKLDQVSNVIASFFSSEDYGDAPSSYLTTALSGGASHIATGPMLGTLRDIDQDGNPNVDAMGDDLLGDDDEDGIQFLGSPIPGETLGINVSAPDGGVLNAWFDFDRSGTFDPWEQAINEQLLAPGTTLIGVDVPVNTSLGKTYARFRITSNIGMATTPDGAATDGEVEDYAVTVRRTAPKVLGEVINGSFTNLNRSGIGTLQLRFDQPVTVNNAQVLRVVNRTTGQTMSLTNATLLGNGTASLTWKFPAGFFPNGRYTYELAATAARNVDGISLIATAAGEFHVLAGDANGDVKVDQADYVLINSNISGTTTVPYRPGDINGDAKVNATDLSLVTRLYSNAGLTKFGLDFGDANEVGSAFPTRLGRNGARHLIVNGPQFGTRRDAETDGQPNSWLRAMESMKMV
ncbi:MAG: GEVED domain-containing protein [Pirellulales bacterium]